jgi:hypothetical protein
MKFIFGVLPVVALVALALSTPAALARGDNEQGGYQGGGSQGGYQGGDGQGGSRRRAPAPLIGASIPGLAIGYGVYWLIRRRRSSRT